MDEIEIVITVEGWAVWWGVPELAELVGELGLEVYPLASKYCG